MSYTELVTARRAFSERLGQISKAGGGNYDVVFRKLVAPDFLNQQPIELMCEVQGWTISGEYLNGVTHIDLHLAVSVMCSQAIANDDTPIDEASLLVLADVMTVVMSDPRQGCDVILTSRPGDAEARDALDQGYYGWIASVYLTVRCDDPNPT